MLSPLLSRSLGFLASVASALALSSCATSPRATAEKAGSARNPDYDVPHAASDGSQPRSYLALHPAENSADWHDLTAARKITPRDLSAIRLRSPVDLRTAILTLPGRAVGDMSDDGRRLCVANRVYRGDARTRRFEFYSDSEGQTSGDAKSMFDLRLMEDRQGRTVAAAHVRRPHGDGSPPSAEFTSVHRLENGRWVDRTRELMPDGADLTWCYEFGSSSDEIPCEPYELHHASHSWDSIQSFSEPADRPSFHLRWSGDRFVKVK